MDETSIGGYDVLDELAASKRFRSFRASRRAPEGLRRGTLYLMTEEVPQPELFIETVDAIRSAWPFASDANRAVVLPEVQLWSGRPWFFLPESLPVAASVPLAGRAAFAALTAQLRWLQQFHPPGGEEEFAHGDVRKERIAVFDAEQPLLIAPGWVAASDYARGENLFHARGDDTWHLGKLWIKDSDHSFVPEGMEPDPNEAARRLPRAVLPARVGDRDGLDAPAPREAATAAPAKVAAAKANAVKAAAPTAPPAKPLVADAPGRAAAAPARAPVATPARSASGPFPSPAQASARAATPPARPDRTSPFASSGPTNASTPAARVARPAAPSPSAGSPPAPAARAAAPQARPAPVQPLLMDEAPVAATVPAPKPRARPAVTNPTPAAAPPAYSDEVITSAPPLPVRSSPAPAPAPAPFEESPRPPAEGALASAAAPSLAPREAVAAPAAALSARPSAPLAAPLAPVEQKKGKGAVIAALLVLLLLLLAAAWFFRSRM